MNNLFIALILSILGPMPTQQVLSMGQVTTVLDSSALIRIKFIASNKDGFEMTHIAGCSGTFVENTILLTAAHCVDMPVITDIWVRGHDGFSHRATLLKKDDKHDLAMLMVNGALHMPAKLAKSVHRGEQVINVGSPFTLEFLISEGVVSAVHVHVAEEFESHYLVTTAMINPGSSGGGAFNKDGELIGVNTMTMGGFMGWAGITLVVSLEDVREFLK